MLGSAPTSMDWNWARRTGGALTPRQSRELTRLYLRQAPRYLISSIRQRLGKRGAARLDFDTMTVPDTTLALQAQAQAHQTLSQHVLQHSYRTYFLGRALAELDQVDYDDELSYVTAMLHDLALESPTTQRCFAVVSAERAMELLTELGESHERVQTVGEAIASHITLGVNEDLSHPGGFTAAGAGADLYGMRFEDIDGDWFADLQHRHPRMDFTTHAVAAMEREAHAVPQGRIAWMVRRGSASMISRAPVAG